MNREDSWLNPNCSECTWRLGEVERKTVSGEETPWDLVMLMADILVKNQHKQLTLQILADSGAGGLVEDCFEAAVECIHGRRTLRSVFDDYDMGDLYDGIKEVPPLQERIDRAVMVSRRKDLAARCKSLVEFLP